MEWRQQTSVNCADAFSEAQRWIEEVTGKSFSCDDFRAALENGLLLCNLINQLKPGIIKRVNRLSTPIAGLDNVTVFLKACGKLGLNDSQLFHPGDLQDLSTRVTLRRDESNRRLKNVLITIYWLGRKANLDPFYNGPQLNFKAFEGLLGLALSKSLDDGGYREQEECQRMKPSYVRDNSCDVDGMEPLDTWAIRPNSEGCGSDAEAEQVFKMESMQPSAHQNKGHIPTPLLRRKQGQDGNGAGCASPLHRAYKVQVRPERPVQVNPGWIWSKSLSDIPMVYPVRKVPDGKSVDDEKQDVGLAKQWSQESKRKCSTAATESEAQWQADLTKWKNRRRSTKSDLRRMSQDREHVINQMINGAVTNSEKNEPQAGPIKRDQSPWRHNPAPRPYSTSPPSKSSSCDLRPHTRALLARSYAIETPSSPTAPLNPHNSAHTRGSSFGTMPASDANILGEETHVASLASDGAGVTTPSLDNPFSSQTHVKAQGSPANLQSTCKPAQSESVFKNQVSTFVTTLQPNKAAYLNSNQVFPSCLSSQEKPKFSLDPKIFCPVNQTGVDALDLLHRNSRSQDGNQKSAWEPAAEKDNTQQGEGVHRYMSRAGSWSGSASLPRGYRRSEGSARLSSAITARPFGTKQSRVSSLPRLHNVDDNQGLLLNSEREDSLSSPTKSSLKRQSATVFLAGQHSLSAAQKKANQLMQTGAEQKKASFQTNGHHYQPSIQTQILPQPHTNLQSHHRKSSTLPSNDFTKVDHSDMRVSLTLKPNSIPDFGFHTQWDSTGTRIKFILPGSPAELCRLYVDDEIVTVDGVSVAHMTYSQWKGKMASALQTGNLTMDIRRYGNKDWSTSEGSHHSLPGQSRVTINLTAGAPVLIGCPDHYANSAASTEMAVAQVSKLNGQTDNVTQGKDGVLSVSTRTNTSKGGSESAISDLQVPSLSPSSSSWSWDLEEDRRRQEKWQEEQERLLQEKYQQDQQRMEAEWRAQQEALEVRKSGLNFSEVNTGGENLASCQLQMNSSLKAASEEQQSPDREKPQSNGQGAQVDKITEQDWAKSLSTPVLTGPHKQARGDQRKRKGQSSSKAEQERQQILEEMKKRTQLLTDNSWIRQRSGSFYKEPVYVGVPMKRYESLDNLDTLRQSPVSSSTFSYPRPHSAAAYFAPSRNASSRYSTGAISSQRKTPMEPSHHSRMVSGRRTCCVCERVLGGGAAMVIEALSLCFHLVCFQCVGCHRHLGGTENGVQVRIRNEKPYCEPCYFQLKSTGDLPM
ncbi:LIM domain only protein 7-like isoform X2 [Parambassis ranga]|uniref:LIM domain only protein 7-like isoform X2 n=1 Tax=Parambassis ranga TaxID=210632 RepID=A0A6P7HWI4_9TELE|nr:LIM domain only protein 7-like isoform X2 [Parambassis ranga]